MKVTQEQYLAQPIAVVDGSFFSVGTSLYSNLRQLAWVIPGDICYGQTLVNPGWHLRLHALWPREAVRAAIVIVLSGLASNSEEVVDFKKKYHPYGNL